MKNKLMIFLGFIFMGFLLVSCGDAKSPFYKKKLGNDDFSKQGNMEKSDFKIDGILDDEEWNECSLDINYGGTQICEAKVHAMVYFGDNGLTIGFNTIDKMISSSTDYNDPQFVVNSDNVEFYIDTKNDKGAVGKSDDFSFLINPEEFAEMRVGTGAGWGPWSGVVDYAVSVNGSINNDSDIDTDWGCEIFLPYKTFGFTKDSNIGVAFGCRDKTTNLTKSSWAGWYPDPQVIDSYVTLNKDGIVKKDVEGVYLASGDFRYDNTNKLYESYSRNSLGVLKDKTLEEGTYSVDLFLSGEASDNGIIFNVKPTNTGLFWENVGASYYFFFINKDGQALLGKTEDGIWYSVASSPCEYNQNDWNNLKVVLTNNKIYCFINGALVIERTQELAQNKSIGIRAGISGIKYKNILVTNSIDITDESTTTIDGYRFPSGNFYLDNDIVRVNSSCTAGAIMINDTTTLTDGTIKVNVKPVTESDSGIVFRVDEGNSRKYWEDDVSYYFFFISRSGTAYLGMVDFGWNILSEEPIDSFSVTNNYELKVVLDGSSIMCYVDDVLYIDIVDNTVSGNKFGIRAGSSYAEFSLPIVE